ncbi:hypothetical protein DICVIV_14407 [Dictyocaulus viviparus]|uniref:Uncharacterized protein n=1 Tax=Dictyocaulus viviparus TaxID=29172 RepID=A0A0D8X5F8_DICVI|nr:hypothetical protein DICVIV_14407 [Dictyocaulus viviparus]
MAVLLTVDAAVVQNGKPAVENSKKNEPNNNDLPLTEHITTPPSSIAKAKSENNLVEELENSPPLSHDEVPIKPTEPKFFDGRIIFSLFISRIFHEIPATSVLY